MTPVRSSGQLAILIVDDAHLLTLQSEAGRGWWNPSVLAEFCRYVRGYGANLTLPGAGSNWEYMNTATTTTREDGDDCP